MGDLSRVTCMGDLRNVTCKRNLPCLNRVRVVALVLMFTFQSCKCFREISLHLWSTTYCN